MDSVSRSEVANIVSKHDSLTLHTQREVLETDIPKAIQATLDKQDPGAFKITRVIVRQVLTDPTIEAGIRKVVDKQKELEAANLQIAINESQTIANAKLNTSFSPAYLQHEYNQALMKFAEKGGTVILDGSMSGKQIVVKP